MFLDGKGVLAQMPDAMLERLLMPTIGAGSVGG